MTRNCPEDCKMEECPYGYSKCPVKEALEEEHRQLEEEKYRDWLRSQ